jgi:hypothetical protein
VKQLESASLELDRAQARRVERRDMLAVWLLQQQREGRKEVRFDEPHLAALMRLCVEADDGVIQAASRIVKERS